MCVLLLRFLSGVHVILKINTYIKCSDCICNCTYIVLAIILLSISSNSFDKLFLIHVVFTYIQENKYTRPLIQTIKLSHTAQIQKSS